MDDSRFSDPCEPSLTLYSAVATNVARLIDWNYYLPPCSFLSTRIDKCVLAVKPERRAMTNTSSPLPIPLTDRAKRAVMITGIMSPSDVYEPLAQRLSAGGYDGMAVFTHAR